MKFRNYYLSMVKNAHTFVHVGDSKHTMSLFICNLRFYFGQISSKRKMQTNENKINRQTKPK